MKTSTPLRKFNATFIRTFIILIIMFTSFSMLVAQTPQYYNYSTSGLGNSHPLSIPGGKQVQALYLPGDFNQPTAAPAGYIAKISIRINDDYALSTWTYSEFTIKLGQAAITSLTAGSFYAGSLTTVYYRPSVTLTAAAGQWLTIELDNTFQYDPTLSLILDISHCGAPGASGFCMSTTAQSGNRRNYSVGGCPFVYSNVASSIFHIGLTYAAQPGMTLVHQAACANNGAVAYNPLQNLFYGVRVGSVNYSLETWSSTGTPLNNTNAGFDWRGMWWNPTTNQLEGNGYGTNGIWKADLNTSGYALNTGSNIFTGYHQPNSQSSGDLNIKNNEIIYYYNDSIYRYSRADNSYLGRFLITGTPVPHSNLNSNTAMYTDHTGKEIALLDYVNKRVYFYNGSTGAYSGMSQLPGNAVTSSIYKTSWAHDCLWTFNSSTCTWQSYKVIDTVPNNFCYNAISLNCGDSVEGTTVNGTRHDAPPVCMSFGFNYSPGVWYTFTGTGCEVNVNTCSPYTSFDTKIGVFSGSCASLNCVAANDDACGLSSSVTFCTMAGTQYYIYVTGFSTSEGNFKIALNCIVPDIVTCPANVNQSNDAGLCEAVITLPTPVSGVDYVNAVSFVNSYNGTNNASGTYPVGTTAVIWRANGNCTAKDSCIQLITVNDSELPQITCPANVNVTTDAGTCHASGVVLGTPIATDNCGVDTIYNDAPDPFPVGVTTVTWTAEDSTGNTKTCSQTVSVTDIEDPVIVCPNDTVLYSPTGSGLNFNYLVTATDNCMLQSLNLTTGLASGSVFPIGFTTNIWTATDSSGNNSSCTFTVTVVSTFGTDELSKIPVSIYPNPTNDNVFISIPEEYEGTAIFLFAADGKMIRTITEKSATGIIECYLNDLSNGIYFLKFMNADAVFYRKIIKN